ncbi:flagellin [Aureimonas glaciei]|nr:flagellin [Aureimonas glaciei]
MVSINNTAANSFVLASLRQTNNDMTTAQTRIGTGLKINGASDGSALWATAQSIRADIKTQDSLTSGISIAKGKVDAAVAGIDQITKLLDQVKELKTTAAAGTGATVLSASTLSELKSLNTQIAAVIAGSGFQSANYLSGTAGPQSVKIGSDTLATMSVATLNVSTTGALNTLTAAITAMDGTSTNAAVVALDVTAATDFLTGYQTTLSSFSAGLESQLDFLNTLNDIKSSALSSIVDADMEEESAKLTALQVKQQLAYQALAITNSSSQNILRLFQ